MKNKRLKIGIFMDNYYPSVDGVVLVVDNLAKELSKNNDVTVVVPYTITMMDDKNRSYEVKRIRSYPIPFSEYRLSERKPRFSRAYKYLMSKEFDIIHIHSPFAVGELGLRIARNLGIPCVCTMHTRFDYEFKKRIDSDFIVDGLVHELMRVYNSCDAGIAINKKMIKVYKDYGCTLKPTIIYNGTDLTCISDKEGAISRVNKLFKLKKDEKVFLFVGRIIDIKNVFFILDSLKLLKEDGFKYKMIYVGDGPDAEKLKSKVHEYGMEDEVILTGKIMDRDLLSSIYYRSDLFLFPSVFDASSLVQIEAAVNETPGLFIEGSVTADTVINNVSGFTCDYSVVSFKDRIKEIFNDMKLYNEVKVNARKMLGKKWIDIAKETYKFYIETINKKGIK